MFAHHGSKAAGNMVGHLLSYDLKERGVPLAMIHVSCPSLRVLKSDTSADTSQPGFLKTEMTKNAGMEQFYEKMGGESWSMVTL